MEVDMDIEDNIVDNFSSDKEDEEEINDNTIHNSLFNNVYTKEDYEQEYIYNKLVEMEILVKEYYCPVCHNRMKLSNDKSVLDKKLWRCKSSSPKHDIK